MADTTIHKLKDKLSTLLRQKDLAAQKAQMLEDQAARDKQREDMMTQLVQQLMDRQRELNIMLNRSHLMLSRSHEANMALSIEFSELCHALPAPEDPEVKERIKRINELFTKTGIDDAELSSSDIGDSQDHPESVIVTPPPRASEPDSDVSTDIRREITTDAVIRQVSEETIPESETRPVITPSLEALFKSTGTEDTRPLDDFSDAPAIDANAEKEPIPAQADVDANDGRQQNTQSERRWWQLIGRH